jgi:aerobic C4-dicarboxylate transport protein
VATLLVGTWSGEFDKERALRVLRGEDPFDETTMLDEDEDEDDVSPGKGRETEPARV